MVAKESICWKCKRPVGDCRFLTEHIPYQGSCWEQSLYALDIKSYSADKEGQVMVATMLKCPYEVK